MGEAGRLSLEDSERLSEDRLRLVCSRLDCLVILRNKELRFLPQDASPEETLRQKHGGQNVHAAEDTACFTESIAC